MGINIQEAFQIQMCIQKELKSHNRKMSKTLKMKELIPDIDDILKQHALLVCKSPIKS